MNMTISLYETLTFLAYMTMMTNLFLYSNANKCIKMDSYSATTNVHIPIPLLLSQDYIHNNIHLNEDLPSQHIEQTKMEVLLSQPNTYWLEGRMLLSNILHIAKSFSLPMQRKIPNFFHKSKCTKVSKCLKNNHGGSPPTPGF